jgi:ubiquinone/menaquinone biosynthesis C-methylase UbiE
MITSDGLFTGSIPLLYNQLMVPMLFEPYAADLATRVQKLEPVDVLETAAGTGAVTRAMAGSVSTIAHITATD